MATENFFERIQKQLAKHTKLMQIRKALPHLTIEDVLQLIKADEEKSKLNTN